MDELCDGEAHEVDVAGDCCLGRHLTGRYPRERLNNHQRQPNGGAGALDADDVKIRTTGERFFELIKKCILKYSRFAYVFWPSGIEKTFHCVEKLMSWSINVMGTPK